MKSLSFALILLTTTACAEAHFFGYNGRWPGHAPDDGDSGDDGRTPPAGPDQPGGPGQDAVPGDADAATLPLSCDAEGPLTVAHAAGRALTLTLVGPLCPAGPAARRVVVLVEVSDRMGPHQLPPPSQGQTDGGGAAPGLDPLTQATCARRDAALALVAALAGTDAAVAVLPFAAAPREDALVPLANAADVAPKLTADRLCAARTGEGANAGAALTRARGLLAAAQGPAAVVLLTAGEPTLPEAGAWPAAQAAATALRALPATTLDLLAVVPLAPVTRENYGTLTGDEARVRAAAAAAALGAELRVPRPAAVVADSIALALVRGDEVLAQLTLASFDGTDLAANPVTLAPAQLAAPFDARLTFRLDDGRAQTRTLAVTPEP